MGQYLTWNIPRTRTLKFVQTKSLGSQMATPANYSSSLEPLA